MLKYQSPTMYLVRCSVAGALFSSEKPKWCFLQFRIKKLALSIHWILIIYWILIQLIFIFIDVADHHLSSDLSSITDISFAFAPLLFSQQAFNTTLNDASTVEAVCNRFVTTEYFTDLATVRLACKNEFGKQSDSSNPDNYYWLHKACEVGSGFLYDAPAAKNIHHFQKTGSKVYLYSFDHYIQEPESLRAARSFHNLDLLYIENFFSDIFNHTFTAEDTYIRNLFSEMLANFAKTGRPFISNNGVIWDPAGETLNYLSVKYPAKMSSNSFHADSVRFWNEITPQY